MNRAMSTYVFQRYPRKSAMIAKDRIKKQFSHYTDTVKPDTNDDEWVEIQEKEDDAHYYSNKKHDFNNGCLLSIYHIKQILTKIANTTQVDIKTELFIKLYEHLQRNPSILVYYPKFRTIVLKKMYEFEELIQKDEIFFASSGIEKSAWMLEQHIYKDMKPCAIRDTLHLKINDIQQLISEYKAFLPRTKLQCIFSSLKHTLEEIKTYPEYVAA